MAKDKFARFMQEVRKIQSQHKGEIDGLLIDYFVVNGNGLPLHWENKPIPEEIKKKVVMAAFHNLAY